MTNQHWRPDILDGYEATDLPLPGVAPAPGEPTTDPLVATLVRRLPASAARAAVLYLPGWNDYFFLTHLADRLAALGYDFFTIDLRRCGRSLRTEQLRGYIEDLDDYDDELSQAANIVSADHDRLIVFGQSAGGLVAALWAARRPEQVHALVLTSPWLDLHRPVAVAAAATRLVDLAATRIPTRALRLPDAELSIRSVHRSFGGEWDYDLSLKASPSPPLRLGWLRAMRAGHARVAAGLGLPMPVLALLAARHTIARRWRADLRTVDTVIDVDHVARRALQLGDHVTVVRLPGAMHDLLLSGADVRERALAEITRWCAIHG